MPRLKDLNCSIELLDNSRRLQEFGTSYGDGFVETFVAVPSTSQSFSIHLTSEKFVAPGIAMYVFMDGVYQCNRNRQDLKVKKGFDSRSLVDFRVRQKEEKQKDGSMIAREWKFEKLDTTSADDTPDVCSPSILENIGCIEVLVLRCAGPRTIKTASAMNMDGAVDLPPKPHGMDGQSDRSPMYDDRGHFVNTYGNVFGPPPPIPSYRAPYAETAHSHDSTARTIPSSRHHAPFFSSDRQPSHLQFPESTSPGARLPSIPSGAYQYGSGPIPTGPMAGSGRSFYNTHPTSAVVTAAPNVDPKWLNEVLTEAVRRGVDESRREAAVPLVNRTQYAKDLEMVNQPPGAWPSSPFIPSVQPVPVFGPAQFVQHGTEKDQGTLWVGSQGGWGQHVANDKTATHVSWDTTSESESWSEPNETQSDTWDTEDTWETKRNEEQRASQRSKSRAPTATSQLDDWPDTSIKASTRKSRLSKSNDTHKRRSKSRSRSSQWDEEPRSSSEDRDGWTHVEEASDLPTSWELSDDTLQNSKSRSKLRGLGTKGPYRKLSHGRRSAHSNGTKASGHTPNAGEYPASMQTKVAQSAASIAAPTKMNAPSTINPPRQPPVPPRRPVRNTEPAPSIAAPPPTWDSAPSEKSRKQSFGVTNIPAPFNTTGNDLTTGGAQQSTSPSSWGGTRKHTSRKHTKTKPSPSNGWGEEEKPGEENDSWTMNECNQEAQYDSGWGGLNVVNKAEDQGWDIDSSSKFQNHEVKETSLWGADNNAWDTKKDVGSDSPAQGDSWSDKTNNPEKSTVAQWNNDTAWPSSPTDHTLVKAASVSKRHTSKSLSKYRQLRPTASDTGPKSHWQFPPPAAKTSLRPISEHTTLPPEPLLKVSSAQASEKGIQHQVRAGAGTQYDHIIGRPAYIDTLDKPYAVFRFKYRSRAVLKAMFGDEVPAHGHLTAYTHTSKAQKEKEKEKLENVSKDELIEKMLKLQTKLAMKDGMREGKHTERGARSLNTECVARDLTEKWVKQHSREASEKGKKKGKAKTGNREDGNGWKEASGDAGWGGGGW